MKKLLFLASLLFCFYATGFAQNAQPIEIRKKKLYRNGEQIKKLKDLKAVILETNDPEAKESLKKAENLHAVSLGTMGTGVLTMLVALTQFDNDGSIESLDNNNKAGVTAAAGGVILLTGAILSGIGRKKRVQAAEYHNHSLGQTTGSFIRVTPASSGLGIGLNWNF